MAVHRTQSPGIAEVGTSPGMTPVRVRFSRELAAPPSTVWAMLTEPDLMNAWSEAKVVSITPQKLPDEPGARRQVTMHALGITGQVVEEVVAARPFERYEYRLVSGMGIRGHSGVITLEPTAAGTRLSWDIEFGGAVPGWAPLFRSVMVPAFERSLAQLARLAAKP